MLVPIKHSTNAKSRLLGATRSQQDHAQLVHAIQLDTLDAVLAVQSHPLLGGLSVVMARTEIARMGVKAPPTLALPAQIEVLADAGGGLNAALAAAAAELSRRYPQDGVVAMVGDLPALRPAELLLVLAAAGAQPRSFVRDAEGSGTTLLAAAAGQQLDPRFGPDSARRHVESGAAEIEAGDSVRRDVDSAEDLRGCLQLGVGLLTAQLTELLG